MANTATKRTAIVRQFPAGPMLLAERMRVARPFLVPSEAAADASRSLAAARRIVAEEEWLQNQQKVREQMLKGRRWPQALLADALTSRTPLTRVGRMLRAVGL